MAMDWHDLLFIHWPVSANLLRPLIPRPLELETFDSTAWIGVIPFRMTGVRPRQVPARVWQAEFAELNVRTYVRYQDKPGVWFFSLDAASRLAVRTARALYHLPYYYARMTVSESNGTIFYQSRRMHKGALPAEFAANYRPTGTAVGAVQGSLAHWLTERYCLYAADRSGKLFRSDIHHLPWPLQPAEAEINTNAMTESLGINLPEVEPLLHFAKDLRVVAWALRRC